MSTLRGKVNGNASDEPTGPYLQLKQRLKLHLGDLVQQHSRQHQKSAVSRDTAINLLQKAVQAGRNGLVPSGISEDDQQRAIREVVDDVMGYGPLDIFLSDPTISEIMINGAKEILIERE